MTGIQLISGHSNIEFQKWSSFVQTHPDGNVFQSPELYFAYAETLLYSPVVLFATDENLEIQGLMVAIIMKEHKGLLGLFSSRSIIFGGPLIKNNDFEILSLLLNGYDNIIKGKAIYTEFRNFLSFSQYDKIFKVKGYSYKEHLNFLVDLSKSEEQLWKAVHSKRRNEIRKAKKEDVEFLEETSSKMLKDCYLIISEVYSRVKLPLPEIALFENMINWKILRIFNARYNNKIIGCMLTLNYKNCIYDFYAGSNSEFYQKCPNDLIPWEIFLWGKKNGFEKFDFGGAGKPNINYGVREYKKKYGGMLVNYGRYKKIHKKHIFIISKLGFNVLRKFKFIKFLS